MMDLLVMLPALALGWAMVRLLARVPRLLAVALGLGIGAGAGSVIYFLLLWIGIASRFVIVSVEAVLVAFALWLVVGPVSTPASRFPNRLLQTDQYKPVGRPASAGIWILRIAALISVSITAADFAQALNANPDGEYDAAAIWNLGAKYLAAGAPAWRYAVSDKTGTNHPGYPLLTSAFIARSWVLIGDLRTSTPAAVSALFSAATAGVLIGAVWIIGGEAIAWLALMVLAATEGFISQMATQYADIPLAFFIVAAMGVLAACEWSPGALALAGVCAGLATWTKNEGLPFLIFAAAVVAWRGGARALKWLMTGAAPVLILTLAFKLILVEGREAMFPQTVPKALRMIGDLSRWIEIVSSFARNFWEMGFPWAHPVLLVAVLVWSLGLAPEARERTWLFIAPLGLLAADFGIYLITNTGLTWHLSTSNNRVIAQVWPAILLACFAVLRPPVVASAPAKKKK